MGRLHCEETSCQSAIQNTSGVLEFHKVLRRFVDSLSPYLQGFIQPQTFCGSENKHAQPGCSNKPRVDPDPQALAPRTDAAFGASGGERQVSALKMLCSDKDRHTGPEARHRRLDPTLGKRGDHLVAWRGKCANIGLRSRSRLSCSVAPILFALLFWWLPH